MGKGNQGKTTLNYNKTWSAPDFLISFWRPRQGCAVQGQVLNCVFAQFKT